MSHPQILCQHSLNAAAQLRVQPWIHLAGTGPVGHHYRRRKAHVNSTAVGQQHVFQRAQSSRCSITKAALRPVESPSGVRKQMEIPEGQVTVTPLQSADIPGAAVLLSRAFAGSPEALTYNDITKYYTKMMSSSDWSRGLVLVARLYPTDTGILPKDRDSILMGTMSISFDESTRIKEVYPPPPSTAGYLTNMAIDARFRRRGVASLLLQGGLEGARASGKCSDVYLHVRDKDTPALALYQKLGFVVHRKENVPGGIFGMLNGRRPQTLMKFALA